jgi:chemotaxis protein methyltransferase CheR
VSNGPVSERELSSVDHLRFQALIAERSGLHFPDKRRHDLASAVLRGLAESGVASLDEYYRVLTATQSPDGRAAFEQLINFLTVGETHFFRDEAQFNALERAILPERLARAATGPRRLRLWSAGCASGEEPYSLAMVLHDLVLDRGDWDITILACDINRAALLRARDAIYGDWSFREERARAARGRFFSLVPRAGPGGAPRYRLSPEVREQVVFAPLNLAEDAYPALYNNTVAMDVILCRNVLIYFHEDTVRAVLARLVECLVPGGWLVLGHADPVPGPDLAELRMRTLDGAVAYQRVAVAPAPAPEPVALPPVVLPPPRLSLLAGLPADSLSLAAALPAARPVAPEPVGLYDEVDALLRHGHAALAIARLEAHLAASPDDAGALARVGEAYANLARWNHAREACSRAAAVDPLLIQAHFVLGLVQEHTGDLGGAQESFRRVIFLDRGHVLAHFALAGLHQRTGRDAAAGRSLRNAMRLLAALPAGAIIPGSGGTTAGRLLVVARDLARMLPQEDA